MKSILIVDDQYGIRVLLSEILGKGYKMFDAANGVKALEILKEHEIDLILLDIKLPGMDGIEIFKRAKEIGYNNVVVTMSAYQEHEKIAEAKDLGASVHFAKPMDLDEMIHVLTELVPVENKSVFRMDKRKNGNNKKRKKNK